MEIIQIESCPINVKKQKRLLSKKRKLEALLNLYQSEEKMPITEKKRKVDKDKTLQDDCKALKDELKKYVKKPDQDPCFYITEIGLKSQLKIKGKRKVRPLFVENIYQLTLKAVINHMSPYTFEWAKLEQPQCISKTVLLIVEGLTRSEFVKNWSSFPSIATIFPHIVEIASSNLPFPKALTNLHKVTHFHIEQENAYSSMFPSKKVVKIESTKNKEKLSRIHLLLSPIQLVMENYPLPQSVFNFSKSENYTFSKDKYKPVSDNSPLFAVDCEMCRTQTSNNDLVRVAVVNENLELVYESLVRPKSKITDYMTKFSGITKSMLKGVKTTVQDVQRDLRRIFPPDAILCGQSLNFDLHALKMIHPYCIDTSIIFNGSGMRSKKDSLKYLSLIHLKEEIQCGKSGHNPIEDAVASMKLVQLKLDNSVQFGDACLKENASTDNNKSDNSDEKENIDKDGFFNLISKHQKNACLIGSIKTLDLYGTVPEIVQKKIEINCEKAVETTVNNMDDFDLTISHLDLNESTDSITELNKTVNFVFDSCSQRTMLMIYLSPVDNSNFEDIKNGIFMATVKK